MATQASEAAAPSAEDVDALLLAAQVLVGITAQSMAEVEEMMPLPQWRVLVVVASRGEVNLTAVAQVMGVHPSNATRACDRLVAAGLLDRHDSAADRRHLALTLTEKGRELVDSVSERRRAAAERLLAQMPPARRRGLVRAMASVAGAAEELPVSGLGGWTSGFPG